MKIKGSLLKQEGEFELELQELTDFFSTITPEFVRQGGGILTDWARYWKWQNLIKIVKRSEKFIKENKLKKHNVPLKLLIPLLEKSTMEEEESMQDKWAALLARAISGDKRVKPNFVSILAGTIPRRS